MTFSSRKLKYFVFLRDTVSKFTKTEPTAYEEAVD
jgi:hypothetical protein